MEIITGMAEKELIGKIKQDFKRGDDGRLEFKRQALVNVMFLYGKQHFVANQRRDLNNDIVQRIVWELEALRGSKKLRRTSNYILPLFRSLYSRLIRMKANIHADPMTSMESDRSAARICKHVGEDFFENCNRNNPWYCSEFSGMQAVLMKLILYKMTIGTAYLIPWFNPKATALVYDQSRAKTKEAIIQAPEVGEAEVRVASVLDVVRDRLGRFTIERRFMAPEQVEYEYDQEVEPQPYDEDTIESQLRRLLEGSNPASEEKEGTYVYCKWGQPTKDKPNGSYVCCTDDKVLFDGTIPSEHKNKIPVIEFRYQDLGFSRFGQGALDQVIDLQQDYNETLTRFAHYKRTLTGKVLAPRGAKLSAKWDDEVGQILYYTLGYKPGYENGAQIPAYMMEEIARIRHDMENIMNSHDASMGQTPGQVKSGIGIQNLSERDDAQIAPEMIMFEQRLGFFLESIIDIMQEKYSERRLLSITGEDLAYEVKSFIGSDLFGQKKLRVRMGSGLPSSLSERQTFIDNMVMKKYISPDKGKELMEFGDIDGVFTTLDETAAKNDIMNIIEGGLQVIAEPWEDHTIFLKVINDFRKGTIYSQKLPPQTKALIDQWAGQHEQMLLQEQQAAPGGLPPAAQPQNPGPQAGSGAQQGQGATL